MMKQTRKPLRSAMHWLSITTKTDKLLKIRKKKKVLMSIIKVTTTITICNHGFRMSACRR